MIEPWVELERSMSNRQQISVTNVAARFRPLTTRTRSARISRESQIDTCRSPTSQMLHTEHLSLQRQYSCALY